MPIYMQLTISATDQLPAVQLIAFTETIGNTDTFGSATGGKVTASPLLVTMGYEAVIPLLLSSSATGRLLPAVQFTFKGSANDTYPAMIITLTNAIISSVTLGAVGLPPGVEMAFIYEKIEIQSINLTTGGTIEDATIEI